MSSDRATPLTDLNGREHPLGPVNPRSSSRDSAFRDRSGEPTEVEDWREAWPYAAPISHRAQQGWHQHPFPAGGIIISSIVLGGLVAAGWHSWRFVAPMLQDPDPPQFQEAVSPTPALSQEQDAAAAEDSDTAGDAESPLETGQRGRVIEPLGLYLRSRPDADAGVLGGIVVGETVTILEVSSDGEWQRVRRELNDTEGWVKSGYLEFIAPNGSETEPQDPEPQPSAPQAATGTHKVIEPLGLYLRSAPDANAERLGGIVQGEAVTLLETSPGGQWQRVRRELNGAEGWVKAGNLDALGPEGSGESSAPAVQPAPATPATPDPNLRPASDNADLFTYAAGNQARVMSPIGLALRAEPGAESTYMGGIPVNEVVQVLGVSPDGQWQKVRRQDGQEGWVKAGNLGPE